MLPSDAKTWDLIRYVVAQTLSLEADLAACLHDVSLRLADEGRAVEAAEYRAASIRHRVRALEMEATAAAAGLVPEAAGEDESGRAP